MINWEDRKTKKITKMSVLWDDSNVYHITTMSKRYHNNIITTILEIPPHKAIGNKRQIGLRSLHNGKEILNCKKVLSYVLLPKA